MVQYFQNNLYLLKVNVIINRIIVVHRFQLNEEQYYVSLNIDNEFVTFSREQVVRQKWHRSLLTRQEKRDGRKDFPRLQGLALRYWTRSPIDKFSILLIEPLNAIKEQE